MSIINWTQYIPAGRVNNFRGTYVELPAFSVTSGIVWRGASEVVLQYNYSASSSFVLLRKPVKPSGVNYGLCIRYRVGSTVYRYKLWEDGAFVLSEDAAPLYNGQVIKKNFVLEIWSFDGLTEVSQVTPIDITSSIRNNITDLNERSAELLALGAEFSDLGSAITTYQLTPATDPSVWDRWIADFNYTPSTGTWVGLINDDSPLVSSGLGPPTAAFSFTASVAAILNKACINAINVGSKMDDGGLHNQQMGILVFRQNTWVADKYLSKANVVNIQQKTVSPRIRLTHVSSTVDIDIFNVGDWGILAWYIDADGNIGYRAFNFSSGVVVNHAPAGSFNASGTSAFQLGGNGINDSALFSFAAYATYVGLDTDALFNDFEYFVNYYQGLMQLPLSFNTGGPWEDNN